MLLRVKRPTLATSDALMEGKNFSFQPDWLPSQLAVKTEKLQDAEKLLKEHFRNDWKTRNNIEFYKDVDSRTIRMDENFEDTDVEIPPNEINEFSVR